MLLNPKKATKILEAWRALDPNYRGYKLNVGFLDGVTCVWINVSVQDDHDAEFVSELHGGDVDLMTFLMKLPPRHERKNRGAA